MLNWSHITQVSQNRKYGEYSEEQNWHESSSETCLTSAKCKCSGVLRHTEHCAG